MKRYTVVSIALVLPLGAYVLLGSAALPRVEAQGPDQGAITLQVQGAACQASVTDRIRSKRGRVVQWNITNNCGDVQTVRLLDFQLGNQNRDPLGCPAADRSKQVGTNGHAVITCPVKGDAGLGRYTYQVALDGQAGLDPELEIEN